MNERDLPCLCSQYVAQTHEMPPAAPRLKQELCVDGLALCVEKEQGIDVGDFWAMWAHHPAAFFLLFLSDTVGLGFGSISIAHLVPTPFFCTSSHPCSCQGGGFEIYVSYLREK